MRRRCLHREKTLGCFKIEFLENHKLFDVFDFTDVSRHMVSAGKSNRIVDDFPNRPYFDHI